MTGAPFRIPDEHSTRRVAVDLALAHDIAQHLEQLAGGSVPSLQTAAVLLKRLREAMRRQVIPA